MKKLFVIILLFCLVLPSITNSVYSYSNFQEKNKKIVGKIYREIEIQPESDYVIKYNSNDLTLQEQNTTILSSKFSDTIKNAIAKSPKWIQNKLARRFLDIDNKTYAELIINANKKYVDEIAFIIATSSIGNIPSAELILDSVLTLYENDYWINYSDIIDYDDTEGNYYSTIKYKVLENGIEKQFEYPTDIYYWYVVHPEIGSESAEYIYDEFWNDYLLNHNDLGYPLLKEKISEINYLWDCESYSQYGNRLWTQIIEEHPTAIEAISYWIGKTVPAQALGTRPNQPNIIAHEHNGWCGELQRLAVAVQRTCLIPSVGVFNIGEDHVWREFYERGWHQNDNWWSDTGGTVDVPLVYAHGWGKDMSSIFAWKGDDSIYDVTSTYIPDCDRKTISFNVFDRNFKPVDGARVTVTVWGPNDITWLKYRFFQSLENIWNALPSFLQGRFVQYLFDKLNEKINGIPDTVDGPIYSIWNYTNISGKCSFELGQNHSYLYIIQYGNLKKPFGIAKHNKIRTLKNPTDKKYNIWLPALSPIKSKYKEKIITPGDLDFKVSFNTYSYQVHQNILWIDDNGVFEKEGMIDFFILDEDNFNKYKNGQRFDCYNFLSCEKSDFIVSIENKDWYLVFKNNARNSNVVLDFTASSELSTNNDRVQITYPIRDIFDKPIFNIGELIKIRGISTDNILLIIDEDSYEITIEDNEWSYILDTTNLIPGEYLLTATCGNSQDDILIKLIDNIKPHIEIHYPLNYDIFEDQIININGIARDNYKLDRVDIKLDSLNWLEANGTNNWSIYFDLTSLELGDHVISARAIDKSGCISYNNISIILNESGHNFKPEINSLYHLPENPTNTSNIIIYANVTSNCPFNIKQVILIWKNDNNTKYSNIFRYADNPIQKRHEEDPLNNQSNDPIYGLELGQFPNDTDINYQIKAIDYANNAILSDTFTIKVQD